MISQESTADVSVKLEYPACPVCGGDQRHFPFRLHEPYRIACCEHADFTTFTRGLWRPRCKRCIANPRITRAAPAGTQTRAYTGQEAALRATFKTPIAKSHQARLTGGDLLEVGCGYGYLLDEARSLFSRRVGTEFFGPGRRDRACNRCRGARWRNRASFARPQFDCIVAIQVIEHVYQPLSFVKQLASHTKAGGYIVVATPDIGGALRRTMADAGLLSKSPNMVVLF